MEIIPESERKQTRSESGMMEIISSRFSGWCRRHRVAAIMKIDGFCTKQALSTVTVTHTCDARVSQASGDSSSAISCEAVTGEQVDSRSAAVSASIAILYSLRSTAAFLSLNTGQTKSCSHGQAFKRSTFNSVPSPIIRVKNRLLCQFQDFPTPFLHLF